MIHHIHTRAASQHLLCIAQVAVVVGGGGDEVELGRRWQRHGCMREVRRRVAVQEVRGSGRAHEEERGESRTAGD